MHCARKFNVRWVVPKDLATNLCNISLHVYSYASVTITACRLQIDKLIEQLSTKPDGTRAPYLEMPLSVGPAKQLEGKQGEKQLSWDVAVHPDTIEAAMRRPQVMQMLIEEVSMQLGTCAGGAGGTRALSAHHERRAAAAGRDMIT